MIKDLEYFIELIGQSKEIRGSFNLWAKKGKNYHNIATLFYGDPVCGYDWSVDEIGKAVSYSESDIKDELENPLKPIPKKIGERLASMDVSVKEVSEYLVKICEEKGNIAGMKFSHKSSGGTN